MTQAICQDQASLPDEAWNDADIGEVPGPKQKGRFRPFKRREGGFEECMGREGSADQARSSRPCPILFRCLYCGVYDFRMGRKSQVIVGGQQDDLAPCMVDGRPCA